MRVDWQGTPERVRKLARRLGQPARVLRDFGAHLVRQWSRSYPRTPTGQSSAPGGPPAIGNRGLANSLTSKLRRGGHAVEAGSSLRYAGVQHRGATIFPKRAKALTIPIHPRSRGKRARDFGALAFRPTGPGGSPHVFGVLGSERGGFTPLFALARQVTLPARPWMVIHGRDWDYLERRIRRHLSG